MKRLLLFIPFLLSGCHRDPNYVDPKSPTAYCARIAGQAIAITSLRDGDMSSDTVKAVLSVDVMESREKEQTLKMIDMIYSSDHESPELLKAKIELKCHQENWTPDNRHDIVIYPMP